MNELKRIGLVMLTMICFIGIIMIGCGIISAITEHGFLLYIIWFIVAAKLFKGLINK